MMNIFSVLPEYSGSITIFVRGVGLIYFIALMSLYRQHRGLFSSKGIYPVQETLRRIKNRFGKKAYSAAPTLFWINARDSFLVFSFLFGLMLSVFVMLGIFSSMSLLGVMIIYLSWKSVGNEFLNYQWDVLLIECGVLAFLCSLVSPIPLYLLLLIWFFLCRFIFSSGMVKLTSGCPYWRSLTALCHHYESQPLPNKVAYYFHHLPQWFHKVSTFGMFVMELACPIFIFFPFPFRWVAIIGLLATQGLILFTGNYCFFNILSLLLVCTLVPLSLPEWMLLVPAIDVGQSLFKGMNHTVFCISLALFLLNSMHLIRVFIPGFLGSFYRLIAPFCISNGYGLFARMTVERNELEIQGSMDKVTWETYRFKWKPGLDNRAPRLNIPHQPRVDWQLWFSALNEEIVSPWFVRFILHLLKGSSRVLWLMGRNPFPEIPPKYIRVQRYRCRFTTVKEKRETGKYWHFDFIGSYPIMALHQEEGVFSLGEGDSMV